MEKKDRNTSGNDLLISINTINYSDFMTDFIPVLVVAILMLAALLIGFGVIIMPEEPVEQVRTGPTGYYPDEIYLGYNFSVADFQEAYTLAKIKGNVSSGVVSNVDQSVSFDVRKIEEIEFGKLKLTVSDTNAYGRIMIIVNGNVVYNDATYAGTQDIIFTKDILNRTGNTLVVRAEGSGWRIWAPTVYQIDLTMFGEVEDESEKTVTFDLDYIPDSARIRVYVSRREGAGDLIIKLNNYKIYEGKVNSYRTFDPYVMRLGKNTAVIMAEPGSRYEIESAYITFE